MRSSNTSSCKCSSPNPSLIQGSGHTTARPYTSMIWHNAREPACGFGCTWCSGGTNGWFGGRDEQSTVRYWRGRRLLEPLCAWPRGLQTSWPELSFAWMAAVRTDDNLARPWTGPISRHGIRSWNTTPWFNHQADQPAHSIDFGIARKIASVRRG